MTSALQVASWPVKELFSSPEEQWRDVAGFESAYEVSSLGRVRRKETGRILRPWFAGRGYHYVVLSSEGRKLKVGVHVLVAESFHGPRPSPRHEVAHWDGNPTNNHPNNLRWATHAENAEDQRRHGTLHPPRMVGASHPRAKLTDDDVMHIRRIYRGQRGQLTQLANYYGVHASTLKRAAIGAGWTHL